MSDCRAITCSRTAKPRYLHGGETAPGIARITYGPERQSNITAAGCKFGVECTYTMPAKDSKLANYVGSAVVALACTWISWMAQEHFDNAALREKVHTHIDQPMHEGARKTREAQLRTATLLEQLTEEVKTLSDEVKENRRDIRKCPSRSERK